MNFDKIKVSQVLQIIEEDLNVIEKTDVLEREISKHQLVRLRDAFYTVSNRYDELFDLDYTPVNMSVNEFIYEIRELSDDTNIDENEQVIDVLKYELLDYIDANNLFLKKFLSVEQNKKKTDTYNTLFERYFESHYC